MAWLWEMPLQGRTYRLGDRYSWG